MKITEKERQEREFQLETIKIQIYSEQSHSKFTSLLAFTFAYFLTAYTILATILFGKYGLLTWEIGAPIILGSTVAFILFILWDYFKDVKTLSTLIENVKKEKTLPELSKISRKRTEQ